MRWLALVAVVLLFSGCTSPGTGDTRTGANTAPVCTEADGSTLVEEFATKPAWTAHSGTWAVDGGILHGVGQGGFSSFVSSGSYDDLELSISFRITEPTEDAAGAGVVVHYTNETEHQIIRYSVRESGWHLFTWATVAGRQKQDSAATDQNPLHAAGDWVHLRVVSKDGLLQAFDCGAKVLEFQLPSGHSMAGGVGPFLREETGADFIEMRLDA